MKSFNWDIEKYEKEGKFAFVDASPQPTESHIEIGQYDFGALLARIEHAIKKINATRISIDSVSAIFSQFTKAEIVRRELFRITSALKTMKITSILTAERTQEYGDIARFGVEEFVSDNVVIIRNILEDEKEGEQ
jgi:circadian clock protein KaiC